uniref:Specifically androgen-regulated gene protein n=1 Tax=Neogobius melanostomus TaxID=47308 RepID=A0A8C6URY8_9GOBI
MAEILLRHPCTSKPTINLEMLRRRVSDKNIPVSGLSASGNPTSATHAIINHTPTSSAPVSPITVAPGSVSSASIEPTIVSPDLLHKPAPAAELPTAPSLHPSSPPTVAPSEAIEPRSPPAVFPKPKKLPPNIILKSHKPAGGHDSIMGHPSPSDRLAMDPQKVRMEALRKLGLLKCDESPKPLQTRMSWASSSSPRSPPPLKSAPPSAPHTTKINTLVPPSPQATHVPSEPLPDIIPVPTAFSDQVAPSHDDIVVVSSDQASPALDKKRFSSAGRGAVKSATLERSGLGLSSYMETMDKQQTLGELRNSRPRPASLGSGKDFAGEMHLPAPSTSSNSSQKLPRSQGISVLISPGEQSEQSRRKALKKLGLLKH